MDLSKASVHDIHYLKDVKHSGLTNSILIGDKGYLSKSYQLDLFSSCRINLKSNREEDTKLEIEQFEENKLYSQIQSDNWQKQTTVRSNRGYYTLT